MDQGYFRFRIEGLENKNCTIQARGPYMLKSIVELLLVRTGTASGGVCKYQYKVHVYLGNIVDIITVV